ncbi:MAG: hypothetical protein UR26_C0001G0071 [candidate division TM6 bacterium GW2011_GWF2_32_72]|nr:MAG: hypothetical protein UR26_C0001G0071 [candidate division TM6 bacterium GW2011_GWF2_32_72]
MFDWFKKAVHKAVLSEQSTTRLAVSFCLGVYIAFSPFFLMHTWMAIAFSWLFGLNFAMMFAASFLINNPWTMVPVYLLSYFFGHYFLFYIFNIESCVWNPTFLNGLNAYLSSTFGIPEFCMTTFFVGGNLLGAIVAFASYPFVKLFFEKTAIAIQEFKSKKKGLDEDIGSE